jgi:hypothetical protein
MQFGLIQLEQWATLHAAHLNVVPISLFFVENA